METLKNALEWAHQEINCITFYAEDSLVTVLKEVYGKWSDLIEKYGNLVIDSKLEMVDFDDHCIMGVHVVSRLICGESGEIIEISALGKMWNDIHAAIGYRVGSFDELLRDYEGQFLN